jgi:trehalose-6-phosphate synthase
MASYKHYDVLLVNAMFDGMNLVAKEGPLVNERDGVSVLARTRARTRSSASSRCRSTRSTSRRPPTRSTRR